MSVRVAIPILYANLKLHLEKGRQWNVVEHLLLHRVAQAGCTAATLAEESSLPWRLVVEVMIRLMRVGWVELQTRGDETRFQITGAGSAVVGLDSLPKLTRPVSRRGSFAIDQVSGAVYRGREFPSLYTWERLQKLRESADVLMLPRADRLPVVQPAKVVETLLDEDEECKAIDPSGARPVDRYAVVTVVGQTIDGLPPRSGARLRTAILAAASGGNAGVEPNAAADVATHEPVQAEKALSIIFSHDDFIMGGEEHEAAFNRILKKAASRIVIHSTFIDPQRFRLHLPLIESAARRGVRIDILWGKSDDEDGANSTADAVTACRDMLLSDIVRERVHLHGISTESHAKLVLADNGTGGLVAMLGSCNWLSSGFKSFEVSAYFRDPAMVAEIAGKLASMTMGPAKVWSPLTRELASLASSAKNAKRPRAGITVQAALVLGAQHSDYVRLARDEAQREITVTSHRMSPSAETLVMIPARAAAQANDIDVHLYYGKVTGNDGGTAAATMARSAQGEGMRVTHVLKPRLHAKFLAWDDDNVVVTSQNWLSADPPDDLPFSEIGVFLSGPGLARELVGRTRLALESMG
jgi:cardiolipin synthase